MNRLSVAVASALCAWMLGCQQDRLTREGEAESHWLEQCDSNTDCGSGLCVCGVCTEACGPENQCESVAQSACGDPHQLAAACGEAVSVCIRECAEPADCGAGDFECRAGICVGDAPRGCPEQACEPGEICMDGACVSPAPTCGEQVCMPDQVCVDGACVAAPACMDGDIERDACPNGERQRSCVDGRWTEWSDCPSELVQACRTVEQRLSGPPESNAWEVIGQIPGRVRPLVRSALEEIGNDVAPEELDSLRELGYLMIGLTCEFSCSEDVVDLALSDLAQLSDQLAPVAERSQAARELRECTRILAHRLSALQYGYVASVCGDRHGAARAIRHWVERGDATTTQLLCVTRNAHDMCQARYLGAMPLTEQGRCPTCTAQFGDERCELSSSDTCGAAGVCFCRAMGVEGDVCEAILYEPRGAINFGEACEETPLMSTALTGPFDTRQLQISASAGCGLMPAVLDARPCGSPIEPSCDGCSTFDDSQCEPGHPGCEVIVACDARKVSTTSTCEALGGLCAEGWEPVGVCADDLPCEPARECGIALSCQPVRP